MEWRAQQRWSVAQHAPPRAENLVEAGVILRHRRRLDGVPAPPLRELRGAVLGRRFVLALARQGAVVPLI
jgi:hypothetical protein